MKNTFDNGTEIYILAVITVISAVWCFTTGLATLLSIATQDDKEGEIYAMHFLISFIVMIFSLILFVVGAVMIDKSEWKVSETPKATEYIVSLNDSNLTIGRLYMRRGYINESLYYQYIVKVSDDGLVPNRILAQEATIYYDNKNPRVEWYEMKRHWLFFRKTAARFKVYVPNGSVTEDFNVDLQ